MKSKDLIFFGNERLLLGADLTETPIFDHLVESGWNVLAVIVNENESKSRNYKPSSIIDKAKKLKIPVYSPKSKNEILDILKKHPASIAVLVAYGKIVPKEVIEFFDIGIVNIHPSLLPKYRGPSPIETAILNGDKKTGVSLMKLVSQMDAGPIYDQESVDISNNPTKFEIYQNITKSAINLLKQHLEKIALGLDKPTLQNDRQATFTYIIPKSDGLLDASAETSINLFNKIRAYQFYPKPKISIDGKECIVLDAEISKNEPSSKLLSVKCKDNSYLIINSLIAPNGKTMSGQDFIKGYIK